MLLQGEGCREDLGGGVGDGSKYVKGTINHQHKKLTPLGLIS